MAKKTSTKEEKVYKFAKYFTDHVCVLLLPFTKNSVYNMAEIEKVVSKSVGIGGQIVKEILQACLDEDMVITEKIGGGRYYWSFSGLVVAETDQKLETVTATHATVSEAHEKAKQALASARVGREESAERTEKLATLRRLKAEADAARTELKKYSAMDPETVERKRRGRGEALEAVNRWTDNTFSLISACVKEYGVEEAGLKTALAVNASFDVVEEDDLKKIKG